MGESSAASSRRRWILWAVVVLMFGFSGFWAVRQGIYWARQRVSPFYGFAERLNAELPRDAKVLILVPKESRGILEVYSLSQRLHPRAVYLPPPGVETLEGSADWIRRKGIGWVIDFGGPGYDPRRTTVRRLDDRR